MNTRRYISLSVTSLVFVFLMYGCAGYGKIRPLPGDGDKLTVQELIENSDDYNIYYSGYSTNNPSGILFDPKRDNKTLVPGDGWIKVEGRETVSEIVSWIQILDFPWYMPELFSILDSDEQSYGYLFTGWHHLVSKVVDESTLFVNDLPSPPQYYDYNNAREDKL